MGKPRQENDLLFVRQGTFVEEMIGWQDYNDASTAITPLTLTLADTWYPLPNDGAGPFSTEQYKVLGKPSIWDPDTDSFYFKDLFIGGIQILRTSFSVECPSANTEISVRLSMAQGSGIDYSIPIYQRQLKRANFQYNVSISTFFTMDNQETIDYPAQIEMSADVGGVDVTIAGWKILTVDRF